jgi:hypothetical protein
MADAQRTFIELLFASSKKYAAWDPEIKVQVGDWGYITKGKMRLAFWRGRRGVFMKQGNIYRDGKATTHEIPEPVTYGDQATSGITWIVSQNASAVDISAEITAYVTLFMFYLAIYLSLLDRQTPAFVECGVKAAFKFSSKQGAVLAMENDSLIALDHPGSLRALLDDPTMRNKVIVSEVHSCSSYSRYLGTPSVKEIAIGLNAKPPVSGIASLGVHSQWIRSTNAGNFKQKVNANGDRTYFPLFRLVSLDEQAISTGMRGSGSDEDLDLPLPDAVPPWTVSKTGISPE